MLKKGKKLKNESVETIFHLNIEVLQINESQKIRMLCFFVFFILLFFFLEILLISYQFPISKKDIKRQNILKKDLLISPAKRGGIYSRRGTPLALSVDFYQVVISPKVIKAELKRKKEKAILYRKLAKDLSSILSVSEEQVLHLFRKDSYRAPIKKIIEPEKAETIEKIKKKMNLGNEIYLEHISKRIYPQGELASHILGVCGERGLEAIEKYFDEELKGNGFTCIDKVEAIEEAYLAELFGKKIYLTIDERIQILVEKALKFYCEKHKANSGSVIVISPHTGEILAMANYPAYNPNLLSLYKKEEWEKLSKNYIVEIPFEPGSVMKIFTALAALESKKVSLSEKFDNHYGSVIRYGFPIRDYRKPPKRFYTLSEAIVYSSNVVMATVGERLGAQCLYSFLTSFGFGKKTQIELPDETSGILPPFSKWKITDLSRISYGYAISASCIQIASAGCIIANGGYKIKPHLVSAIYDENGKLVKKYTYSKEKVISYSSATALLKIMEDVVKYGTGKKAQLDGIKVAGKTGTAKIAYTNKIGYSKMNNVSFLGIVPTDNPKFVIYVLINAPKVGIPTGGEIAAPLFKTIAEQILPYVENEKKT